MVNRHRGEIEAILDGKSYRLCLTLGALAELEHAFGEDDMLAVAERFEAGRIAARDAIRMIGAGLRGAGYDLDDEVVAAMKSEGGAAGFVDVVARLFAATFTALRRGEGDRPFGGTRGGGVKREDERRAPEPFPWDVAMTAGLGSPASLPGIRTKSFDTNKIAARRKPSDPNSIR
jgi:Phage tail tube protein, GTA-gp10